MGTATPTTTAAVSPPASHRFTVADYYRMLEAGIQELWVVNLSEAVLEVCRDPGPGGYQHRQIHRRGERVAPLAFPELELTGADLLPPGGAGPRARLHSGMPSAGGRTSSAEPVSGSRAAEPTT